MRCKTRFLVKMLCSSVLSGIGSPLLTTVALITPLERDVHELFENLIVESTSPATTFNASSHQFCTH